MRSLYIIVLIAFSIIRGVAQNTPTSVDIRKITGSGPFPMFINIKGRLNATLPLYKDLRESFDKTYEIKGAYLDYGVELSLGTVFKLENDRLRKNVHGLELAFQRMNSAVHRNDTVGLNVNYNHWTLRYQYRMNWMYPITFQFTPGIIMYSRERVNVYQYGINSQTDFVNRMGQLYKGKFLSGL